MKLSVWFSKLNAKEGREILKNVIPRLRFDLNLFHCLWLDTIFLNEIFFFSLIDLSNISVRNKS